MGSSVVSDTDEDRGISPATLNTLRGILISSLSRENSPAFEDVSTTTMGRRKVTFQEVQRKQKTDIFFAGGGNSHEINGQLPATQNPNSQNARTQPNNRTKEERSQIDREERLKLIREKQNEERQRKLEELKQQALAAQKFREKTEEERRRRIEELRHRENDRRHQVEERKRVIMEAENNRREAILRRNMEREARIESRRKMERSSIVFAFGSSTPRMLEPADSGSTYWASRRATSTTNVMCMSVAAPGALTRRSSERELANGNKKRATSAGGLLDRKNTDGEGKENSDIGVTLLTQRSANAAAAARRVKTDLMPTVPISSSSSRDAGAPLSASVSRNSSCSSRRSPGRAFSMTRLDQLSQPRKPKLTVPEPKCLSETNADVSKSMTHLAPGEKKGLRRSATTSKSMVHLGPAPPPRMTRAERLRKKARQGSSAVAPTSAKQATSPSGSRSGETTPRPQSALSQHNGSSGVGFAKPRPLTAPSRKPRPLSIAVTGVTSNADSVKQSGTSVKSPSSENRPPVPKVHVTKKNTSKTDTGRKLDKSKSSKSSTSTTPKETPLQSPTVELSTESSFSGSEAGDRSQTTVKTEVVIDVTNSAEKVGHHFVSQTVVQQQRKPSVDLMSESTSDLAECDMTGSMTSSQIRRITTEEEAKAAIAERRRIAREQAEREAELERQRQEAERLAEEERQRKEEEEQKRMEEEQLRLLEESRKAEQERLLLAIEEAKKSQEEERLRKEEEIKLKLEKEEADRKAKEEAERLRQEMEIKLKKEEEDRQARRKRVEAIMSRTRPKGGNTPSTTPTKDSSDENLDGNLNGVNNKVISDKSNNNNDENEKFLISERNENGSSNTLNSKQNGVHCNIEPRNVTNNLLDLSDFDVINTNMIPSATVSSQLLDLPVGKDNFNSSKQDFTDLLS